MLNETKLSVKIYAMWTGSISLEFVIGFVYSTMLTMQFIGSDSMTAKLLTAFNQIQTLL